MVLDLHLIISFQKLWNTIHENLLRNGINYVNTIIILTYFIITIYYYY